MNIKLQRLIDRWLGIPLCWLLSLWPQHQVALPERPSALLVILLSEMGSLVLTIPMFQYLKTRYPNTRLYALVFKKNRELLDLLNVVHPQDVFTIQDFSLPVFIVESLWVLWQLRRCQLNGVIDCELFSRVSSLFAHISGAPIHVGFHAHNQEGLYRGGFINRPVVYNPYLHISQQFLNLAEALVALDQPLVKRIIPNSLPKIPRLQFAATEIDSWFIRLYQSYPSLCEHKLIILYPSGGALPIRAWPLPSYIKLAQALLDDNCAIGIIGLQSDYSLAQSLIDECANARCVNLVGFTRSVRELLLLFQRTALLITNDGGPGQFAALIQVPSLIFFGPETPVLYSPLSAQAQCLYTQLSCTPCLTAYNHRNTPCNGDNRCLHSIEPEAVIAKARAILNSSYSN